MVLLGGFTQKQITQAPPKPTALSSTHRHRSEPYDPLLTTLSSGEINKALMASWLSSEKEDRLLKVEDLEAQHLPEVA